MDLIKLNQFINSFHYTTIQQISAVYDSDEEINEVIASYKDIVPIFDERLLPKSYKVADHYKPYSILVDLINNNKKYTMLIKDYLDYILNPNEVDILFYTAGAHDGIMHSYIDYSNETDLFPDEALKLLRRAKARLNSYVIKYFLLMLALIEYESKEDIIS